MTKLRHLLHTSYLRYYSQQAKKLPIITCKRVEYNHYEGQTYSKFEGVKLASSGWLHAKSKGDYFTIYGNANKTEELNVNTKSFSELGVRQELIDVVNSQGYERPTIIQAKSIPFILEGYNTALTAETGCGKTLAYLLPVLQQILDWKTCVKDDFNSPLAVIITPSRELAVQIGEVAQNLVQNLNVNVQTLVGGRTKQKMLNPPIEYCDVLVTTLGAFSKLVTTGVYRTGSTHHVVLDEADTLLDDSFRGKLSHLLKKFQIRFKVEPSLPPVGCQLTLVSATLPHELPDSVSSFVDPQSLKTVTTNKIHRLLPHVPHKFMRVGKAQKPAELLRLVRADAALGRAVMVFSNQSATCDFVAMFLAENGVPCANINGRMPAALKAGALQRWAAAGAAAGPLSCTDAAARGLDTRRAQHVLNYDVPLYSADYVHRAGRVGRLGAPPGAVTSLVAWPREIKIVQMIEASVRKQAALPHVNANIRRLLADRAARRGDAALRVDAAHAALRADG